MVPRRFIIAFCAYKPFCAAVVSAKSHGAHDLAPIFACGGFAAAPDRLDFAPQS
jgi:hypothetical protein